MKINKIASLISIIFLVSTLVLEILYGYHVINSLFYSRFIVFFGIISLIIYISSKWGKVHFKFWEFLIFLMSIFSFLSYYFAYDKYVALYGFHYGREGLLVILSYNVFILLGTLVEVKKIIEKLFLIIVGINIFFAFLQSLPITKFIFIPLPNTYDYPSGFLYSASFLSPLTLLAVVICFINYLKDTNKKNYLLLLFFCFGMFLSNVLSSILAFCIILFFSFLYTLFLYKKNKKNKSRSNIYKTNGIILVGIILMFILRNLLCSNLLFNDFKDTLNETISFSKGETVESLGNGRLHIWKEGFKYFYKYKYYNYGIGIDNFAYIGKDHYIKNWNGKIIVYKAHNEFLQILFCEGIYRFLIYVIFLILINVIILKKMFNNKKVDYSLLKIYLLMLAYLIQSFFNISSILVAPFYYAIIGMAINKGVNNND